MEPNTFKIFAIDDIADNLISLGALIKEAFVDAKFLTANNGTEGLKAIALEDPDVILLDIIMPGMDGFDVCKKLKEDKKLFDIPVVFLTALKDDKETRIRALEAGAEAFLSKPIDEIELTAQIRAMVKIRTANIQKRDEKKLLSALVVKRTQELEQELVIRKQVEEEIRKLNAELEQRVFERTIELENSNKALEVFSNSVSHDLRSPLRAVNGYTQLLEKKYKDLLGSDGSRIIQVIVESTLKMDELITGLLAISKISQGEIRKTSIDMNEMVSSIFHEFVSPDDQNKITCKVDRLFSGYGDFSLIHQVVVNLIENAVKYSSKKEKPMIHISSHMENYYIEYSFCDNGCGFNPEHKDKLFTVFQRLHSNEDFPGTGIGLAIVERIIRRHGGKVWAEGEEGQGATFYFSLPVAMGKEIIVS